ncbi:hypothetical protein [Undibacterium sp. Xuan67W]|uniref:hypothetical protein n=1 Tax=Undibacterium sp. Xuan67W TaxID=3413057 RepID=UPI003BF2C4D8
MKSDTKQAKTLRLLKRPRGLNRFEAEAYGDHVLPSTVSALRNQGMLICGEWEEVKTRFDKTVRVKRYFWFGNI